MRPEHPFSVVERLASFKYAIRGLWLFFRTQHNAWIHAAGTLFVAAISWALKVSPVEWSLLVLSIMAVWITETLNTAVEFLTDLVSPDFHPLAGQVKDISAGAVLISAIGATIVGGIVLIPKLIQFF